MSFFVKTCKNEKIKLSTLKWQKNVIKPSYSQSYPHYPHKKRWKMWIIFCKKRTNVLLINDKNSNLSKKIEKKLDF